MTEKLTYNDLKERVQDLENGLSTQNRYKNIIHTLFKISSAINTTSNLVELYKSIHGELSSVIDTTNFFIAIYDKVQDNLTFPYCVDSVDECYPPVIEISKTESLTAKVIRTGVPLLVTKDEMISQRQKSQRIIPTCTLSESWLGVPLKIEVSIIGVMAVQSYDDANCYDQTDLEVLVSAADQVAIAIDRKLKENTLRESESYMRSIFRAAPTGIGVVHDRVFRQVNDKFCEMLGYSRDDLIGTQSSLVYPSVEEFEKVGQEKYEQIKTKGTGTVETVMKRKNGELINVLMSSTPIEVNNLRAGVTFTALDITDRKLAEEALHDSHERFLTVLDSIDATIHVADMQTHEILFMNKYMIDSFGQDMTGEICWKAFRGESAPCVICTNNRLVDKNNASTGVLVWNDENPVTGKKYINHDRAIEWTGGRLVRLQIGTDITDLLSMEAQLRQAQKMESVGRLAGGVAHDFNNMLGVILGHAELAMEELDQHHPIFNDLQQIHQAANRSTNITRQLLAFARQQIVSPKVIDLNETVADMLKMLLRLIGEDIDFAWLPGKQLWPIKIDPSQIDQILANLCVNARDAIAGVGKITVETESCKLDEEYCSALAGSVPGQYVKLDVSDNGSGMDKETMPKIFEPFFTTKGVNEGTGLGLATVYGIVKQNNGFVNVYSEQGQGTTFSIYLPRYMGNPNTEESDITAEPAKCGNETILLIEDDPSILNMTTTMLQRLGHTVLAAGTPSGAIRLADEHSGKIHLVLTDVIMPEMNGRILTEKLMVNRPELICLFMSGYTANVISTHGVLDNGVNFIQKPFAKRELATKIRQALGDG